MRIRVEGAAVELTIAFDGGTVGELLTADEARHAATVLLAAASEADRPVPTDWP